MIELVRGDIHLHEVFARMPFRYGIATMTHMPHAFVRLTVRIDGVEQSGVAADHLPPKWFTKDPAKPPQVEVDEMLAVIRHALADVRGQSADSAFDLWLDLYRRQDEWANRGGVPPLLAHFGTSLVERAAIDAACRSARTPFWRMVRDGRLGVRLGAVHAELAGREPCEFLPAAPLPRVIARHTVGLSDPLTEADVPPGERLADGLPQSLEACIGRYGLCHFKIKVNGELGRDLERLAKLAEVISARAEPGFAFSLDGNEQFRSPGQFREFWREAIGDSRLRKFFDHLLFVEQPLHRDVALSDEVGSMHADWPDRPATIIDESDATIDSLPRALRLGYAGTSHKNCKGVFKGLANRCLLAARAAGGETTLMSGEDLANIGPVALPADLAVMAALGIESVERNGHHYFAGLSMFPPAVQRQVLDAHGDLYARSPDGWPTLAIRSGRLDLTSVNAAPFGFAPQLDVDAFTSDTDETP